MAFTIPNKAAAGDPTQAEVFQASIDGLVGGFNRTGVATGCAVTQRGAGANMSVDVAAGTVLVVGTAAAVTAVNVAVTTADATNPRLDLVVANASGTVSVLAGSAAAAPVEPALDATTYAVLAQVFVPASATSITTARITDRRVLLGAPVSGIFGDGSDGTVSISGTTTLTRDMFYDVLTVTGTGVLNTSGYRVFCRTSCTVNAGGKISADGANASGPASGGFGSIGTLYRSQAGGGGATAAGIAGNAVTSAFGGAGGAGGAGSGGAGGAAGAFTAPAANLGSARTLPFAVIGWVMGSNGGTGTSSGLIEGGSSGGGGGGNGTFQGGGGGAGGGVLVLATRTLTNDGTISANGGNGSNNNGAGTNLGGGGGGGGGYVAVVYSRKSGAGTITATAGTGSAGNGTGVAGGNGSAGLVVELVNA